MCGIAGLLHYGKKAADDIEAMKRRMSHRGPDADGTWISEDGDVVLGHVRLAVIGLGETGAQPMMSHSGRFMMVYNGEIYNFPLLKEKLAERNVTEFRGTSDSEILLEALEHLGIDETLSLIKGMFAVALYDKESHTITLFRDRIGEKPLYYGYVKDAFVFASDIGCIRTLSAFTPEINRKVLGIYFAHGYIPAPHTIYRDIFKLEPGKKLTLHAPFTPGSETIDTYWSVREVARKGLLAPFRGSFEEASAELERLITESIRGQMVADVPVGAFLSGGIDSATCVALMQSISPGSVRSFTIGMNDPAYNEAEYAKEIAAHLGTSHTELYITEKDAMEVIPLLSRMFGEPFADSSQIPTFLVSRMTREYVTVSLSGDGGDELFGGYNSYTSVEGVWNKIRHIPHPVRRLAKGAITKSPLYRNAHWEAVAKLVDAKSPESLYRQLFEGTYGASEIALEKDRLPYAYTDGIAGCDEMGSVAKDIMLMDMRMYHPDDILVKVDRCAMAVSLETRVPLLDKDVVEFAWTLPLSFLRREQTGKLILRDVLYRHVPRAMMERKKTGFAIPVQKWLKGQLREWAESLIDEKKIREQGMLDGNVVKQIWDDFIMRDRWRTQLWFLLMFEAWLEEEYG